MLHNSLEAILSVLGFLMFFQTSNGVLYIFQEQLAERSKMSEHVYSLLASLQNVGIMCEVLCELVCVLPCF